MSPNLAGRYEFLYQPGQAFILVRVEGEALPVWKPVHISPSEVATMQRILGEATVT